jgi:hypothetical protein
LEFTERNAKSQTASGSDVKKEENSRGQATDKKRKQGVLKKFNLPSLMTAEKRARWNPYDSNTAGI